MNSFSLDLLNPGNAVEVFSAAMKAAAIKAIPMKACGTTQGKQKKWNPLLAETVHTGKLEFRKCCEMGRPLRITPNQ